MERADVEQQRGEERPQRDRAGQTGTDAGDAVPPLIGRGAETWGTMRWRRVYPGSRPACSGAGASEKKMMADATVLTPTRRALKASEKRLLGAKIRRLTAQGRRASRGYALITVGTIVVLWLATILASDTPWLFITLFWTVVGGGIALWVRRDALNDARQLDAMRWHLESALRRNAADVYEIQATSFAELEEVEDEGACYVFALEGERLVFIAGQEFYRSATFPTLDFSLVYILNEAGRTVDMFIEKRGSRARPARTITAAVTRSAEEVPEHLEVRSGTIADLERVLARSRQHSG